jgi:flagellar hook assembly protein FlgD
MSKIEQHFSHSRERTDALQTYVDVIRKVVDTIHTKVKAKIEKQTSRVDKLDNRSRSMTFQIDEHAGEWTKPINGYLRSP